MHKLSNIAPKLEICEHRQIMKDDKTSITIMCCYLQPESYIRNVMVHNNNFADAEHRLCKGCCMHYNTKEV